MSLPDLIPGYHDPELIQNQLIKSMNTTDSVTLNSFSHQPTIINDNIEDIISVNII